jgi:GrpB-like predicted nucleotidyltransferase (UPF0157 family)
MATEEQMQAARIGGMRVHNALIRLVDYSAEWPALFVREAERVRATLGGRVLMLEHVGSTSIPGLAAKPMIDMILTVANSADERAYVPAMESAGYLLHIREPEWHQHRLFKGPDTNINLHVYSFGCPEIDKMLMFRDWLRSNDADRRSFARCDTAVSASISSGDGPIPCLPFPFGARDQDRRAAPLRSCHGSRELRLKPAEAVPLGVGAEGFPIKGFRKCASHAGEFTAATCY